MRCRSDPLKMEALVNRLRESTSARNDVQDEEFVDNEDESKDNDQEDEANHETHMKHSTGEGLPECLWLMMCEPKLSMEVSKETWVSGKDFIRRHSRRKKPPPLLAVKSTDGQDESKDDKQVTATVVALVQPGMSSCSFLAGTVYGGDARAEAGECGERAEAGECGGV
ncbi:hypothetical protein L1987_02326 [Smallanthus sonchifolius]|uniref:Uncharacterized protein n=1 Tax=Smallanthus sonchifolius TaxID=185202 RepID=A0ACB9K7N4_9ASTR|nr:hypothetical protein L1987_02326 [Smallanthus sonchifolius]